jgi:hypothetical protein
MRSNAVSWREFRRSYIWKDFLAGVPSYCHPAQERARSDILVQCFTHLRVCCRIKNRAPFPELDRHTHYLTDDFRLLRIA